MAVTHERLPAEDSGMVERIRHLATRANPAFAAGSVAVPQAFVAAGLALGSSWLLFYTHVVSGALWFGFALIFPAVVGPVLGGLDEEAATKVTSLLTPKTVFFVFGFSLATVVSGTALLTGSWGLGYGFAGFWPTAALTAGWGLFVFGLLVPNRLHLKAYYEGLSEDPDPERMASIEKRNLVVGLFEAGVMLVLILTMTGLRLGL
jgi:hypothetical protein